MQRVRPGGFENFVLVETAVDRMHNWASGHVHSRNLSTTNRGCTFFFCVCAFVFRFGRQESQPLPVSASGTPLQSIDGSWLCADVCPTWKKQALRCLLFVPGLVVLWESDQMDVA